MNAFIAKCGCNCAACPTYKDNIQTIGQRTACSSGWGMYLGIRLSPEKLRACDGCSLPDSERKTYYLNCKVRKCCIENGIDNCAFCSAFPCKELESVHSIQIIRSKDDFTSLTGKNISEADYQRFIEPYAGLKHLSEIRNHLKESEIVHFKEFNVQSKINEFPDDSMKDVRICHGLKRIFELISTLALRSNVSYAESLTLRGKREQLLKILIAFGVYGRKGKAENDFLELDAEIYVSQKLPGMYNKLLDCLDDLKEYRIFSEIIVLDPKNWQTHTGGLRSRDWKIRISFGKELTDGEDLEIFKKYLIKLNKKSCKNTYKYFNTADFSVMNNQ
ncbi:MAG: DUF3795 domain-containing protein [Bacteroidales bacterium]|nr:DUF3795 domain-containing protein [Bacteroidales bacterium]